MALNQADPSECGSLCEAAHPGSASGASVLDSVEPVSRCLQAQRQLSVQSLYWQPQPRPGPGGLGSPGTKGSCHSFGKPGF